MNQPAPQLLSNRTNPNAIHKFKQLVVTDRHCAHYSTPHKTLQLKKIRRLQFPNEPIIKDPNPKVCFQTRVGV